MNVVELSDEETVAILAKTFTDSLASIGEKTRKVAVLKRLHELLASPAPQHYIYEAIRGYDELQVLRVGSDQRVYCRLVMGIPRNTKRYNVLFVFYVSPHRYREDILATFDDAAAQRIREVTTLQKVDDVEDYLHDQNAFTAEDIEESIDRLVEGRNCPYALNCGTVQIYRSATMKIPSRVLVRNRLVLG